MAGFAGVRLKKPHARASRTPMLHRLLSALSAVSLLALLLVLVTWMRAGLGYESIHATRTDPECRASTQYVRVETLKSHWIFIVNGTRFQSAVDPSTRGPWQVKHSYRKYPTPRSAKEFATRWIGTKFQYEWWSRSFVIDKLDALRWPELFPIDDGNVLQLEHKLWIVIPCWALAIPAATPPMLLWGIPWLRHRRRKSRDWRGLCPACGYDLRASVGRCPECGAEPPAPLGERASTGGDAVAASTSG